MAEELSYCAQVVKEHDPDRFLLSVMMPAEYRADLLSLFAFYHEIAKTREVVSETMLGQIRLKWWQEAIKEIYDSGQVLEHEVLQELAAVIERRKLSYEHFETLIYAREFDLEDVQPGNLEGLVNYCDFTLSPLMRLVLEVMGDDEHENPVQAVAVNYAIIGLMRAIPYHAKQRRCFLPEDLLKKYNQEIQSGLYEMKPCEGLPAMVHDILQVYEPKVKPQNKFLIASQALSRIYYKQLRRTKFDVFSKKMLMEPNLKALRLVIGSKFL